jgi:hypothetical protein
MASSNLSLCFCSASSAVTRSCPVITRLLPGRCRVCVKGRAAAPRGFQATWYALETARPSSRRLTNLKCYSLPEGLFGSHGDAAFKKIPEICSALPSGSSVNNDDVVSRARHAQKPICHCSGVGRNVITSLVILQPNRCSRRSSANQH